MSVPHIRDWPLRAQIALAFLIGAIALDLSALGRLRTLRDDDKVIPLTLRTVPRIVIQAPNDAEVVREALTRSPFDMETPASTFVPFNAVVQQSLTVPIVRPRLVGTVLEGNDGGFVMVELPDGRMQLIRIGERAGELRLRSVRAGEAVFDDARGNRVSLRTPRPGSESRP